MKRQFLHENHNRQDKANNPAYREEMLLNPREPLPHAPLARRTPQPTYEWTISRRRQFEHLAQPVADVLQNSCPGIDLTRLTDAIRSYAADAPKIRFEVQGREEATPAYAAVNRLLKLIRDLPARPQAAFLKWHDSVLRKSTRDPAATFKVPEGLQAWLLKFTAKPETRAPSMAPSPPNAAR